MREEEASEKGRAAGDGFGNPDLILIALKG